MDTRTVLLRLARRYRTLADHIASISPAERGWADGYQAATVGTYRRVARDLRREADEVVA